MSNPTKLNFFGLPIDDGVRHSSLSKLKLLARNCIERYACLLDLKLSKRNRGKRGGACCAEGRKARR